MAVLGQDCDLLLFHQDYQNGQPVGFLLDRSRLYHGHISVYRSAYRGADGSFNDQQVVSFTLLMGTGLVNPDGSPHTASAGLDYPALFTLLSLRSEIGVITADGVFSGLFSSGNYALEERSGGVLRVTIQLSSDGNIFAPADQSRFEQSTWVDESTYTGSMTWENSYWRA
jgi:hypothetical protein